MSNSWFKRAVCVLLAVQCVLSIPASNMIVAAAAEADQAELFQAEGSSVAGEELLTEGEQADSKQPLSEETVLSWVDIEGNYNAPEALAVYISKYLGQESGQPQAHEKYTGVVAFYDYENDRAREEPYFFYYKDGQLQTEEQFAVAQGYLDLANPPVSASVVDAEAAEPEARVYAGEEVYVDPEAEIHSDYLFLFGQQETENGLFSGEKDGLRYVGGLAQQPESSLPGEENGTETPDGQVPGTEGADGETPDPDPDPEPPVQAEPITPVTKAAAEPDGVKVSWTGDEKAAGYRILRKLPEELLWTAVTDLVGGENVSYLDTTALGDQYYLYAVRGYYGQKPAGEWEDETDALVWSEISPSEKVYYLPAPVISVVYDGNPGLIVRWGKVAGAAQYRVYRKTEGTGWKNMGTVAGTAQSFTDKTAEVGVKYLYTVRGVKGNVLGPYYDYSSDLTKYVCSHATPKVTMSSATQGEESGILVKWTRDAAATGYRLFRKAEGDTGWKDLANIEKGETVSYFDKTAVSNKKYAYTVRAYYGTDPIGSNSNYSSTLWSGYTSSALHYYLAAPEITKYESVADGLKLTWNKVAGATSYRVYRRTDPAKGWTRIGDVTSGTIVTYTDKTAVDGITYYYTIKAHKDNLGSGYIDSTTPRVFHALLNVSLVNDNGGKTGITISWTKPEGGVTSYRVYRKGPGEKSWSSIATLTEESFVVKPDEPEQGTQTGDEGGKTEAVNNTGATGNGETPESSGGAGSTEPPEDGQDPATRTRSYVDANVMSGKEYSYAVRAVFEDGQMNSYTGVSIMCVGVPAVGSAVSAATGMEFSWIPVDGASGYRIYRRTKNTGWVKIQDVTGGNTKKYIDTTAVNATEYFYTAKAWIKVNNKTTYSDFVRSDKGYVFHEAPAVTIANTDTGMRVSWKNDPTATGYRIYRKLEGEKSWTTIANLPGTAAFYDEVTLLSGSTASYAVRSLYADGAMSSYVAKSFTYLSVPVLSQKVAPNEEAGIKVTWDKVIGATGYWVYRKDMSAANPKWNRIATINGGNVLSYIDSKDLVEGRKYFYTVVAVAADKSSSQFDKVGSFSQYLPSVKNLFVDVPGSAGTKITWTAIPGVSQYIVRRRTESGAWADIAIAATNSYVDESVTNKKTCYYYTVRAVMDTELEGVKYSVYGSYDSVGVTFAVKWSGSERNKWVLKSGNQYYVNSKGYCLTGWQYITRYGSEYKYYFDLETGALCTNLYQKFGSSYADMKCKYIVNLNNKSSNPSTVTILLYDAEKEAYNTPAVSVRCIGRLNTTEEYNATQTGNFWLKKGAILRWFYNEDLTCQQYAVFIRGSDSWFHTSIYKSTSVHDFSSASYKTLVANSNTTGGCVRLQAIYAYLFCDIQKNGYGATANSAVTIYRKRSSKPPFAVPRLDSIGSRKTEPTDPAITGKFFYATSVFGVSSKAGAKTWTYYDTI